MLYIFLYISTSHACSFGSVALIARWDLLNPNHHLTASVLEVRIWSKVHILPYTYLDIYPILIIWSWYLCTHVDSSKTWCFGLWHLRIWKTEVRKVRTLPEFVIYSEDELRRQRSTSQVFQELPMVYVQDRWNCHRLGVLENTLANPTCRADG